jgi:uncharacterized protein
MLIKILLTAGVIYIVYIAFFKKPTLNSPSDKKAPSPQEDADEMIACATCNTYTTRDDSIISLGKHYCSQECVGKDS